MLPGKHDIDIDQGATYTAILFFQSETGAPIDLTGSTFKAEIRKTATDPEVLAAFVFTSMDQTLYAGKVTVVLPAAASSAIKVMPEISFTTHINKYIYDLDRTLPDLTVDRVLQGVINMSPQVTK